MISRLRSAAVWIGLGGSITGLYLYAYGDCLRAFFHFDDFWVLGAAASIEEGLPASWYRIFVPVHGFLLYRPLSTVAYFLVLRLLFGNDPPAFHAVQLGFQVVNALLVYGIARSILCSRIAAVATALGYASAPALAIAACWNSLFTATGAAFFSFLGLLAWLRWAGFGGKVATLLCFVCAILASEHGVVFPVSLLAALLFLRARERERGAWAFALLLLACSILYAVAKLAYLRWGLESAFPDPIARAFVLQGYAPDWSASVGLSSVALYFGYSFALFLPVTSWPQNWRLGAGAIIVGITVGAALWAIRRNTEARRVSVVAFGLIWFLASILPVAFLPQHVASYYASVGAAGVSLALVSLVLGESRWPAFRAAAFAVAAVFGFFRMQTDVRSSAEFSFFQNFTWAAERWLRSVADIQKQLPVRTIVVPDSVLAQLVFEQGQAHRVLLCSRLDVRVAKDPSAISPDAQQVILREPFLYPQPESIERTWLPKRCTRRSNDPVSALLGGARSQVRDGEPKRGSASHLAVDGDCTLQGIYKAANNVQTQADTAR